MSELHAAPSLVEGYRKAKRGEVILRVFIVATATFAANIAIADLLALLAPGTQHSGVGRAWGSFANFALVFCPGLSLWLILKSGVRNAPAMSEGVRTEEQALGMACSAFLLTYLCASLVSIVPLVAIALAHGEYAPTGLAGVIFNGIPALAFAFALSAGYRVYEQVRPRRHQGIQNAPA